MESVGCSPFVMVSSVEIWVIKISIMYHRFKKYLACAGLFLSRCSVSVPLVVRLLACTRQTDIKCFAYSIFPVWIRPSMRAVCCGPSTKQLRSDNALSISLSGIIVVHNHGVRSAHCLQAIIYPTRQRHVAQRHPLSLHHVHQ